MRIVFLNPGGELGGAETALIELFAAVQAARPSWTLHLIAARGGPFVDRAARHGISVQVLEFPPSLARLGEWGRRGSFAKQVRLGIAAARAAGPVMAYAKRLRRELASFDPDIGVRFPASRRLAATTRHFAPATGGLGGSFGRGPML